MANLEKLYTIEDVAEMTSLSAHTVRTYLHEGILRGRKIGGKWLFTMEDLAPVLGGSIETESAEDVEKQQRRQVIDFMQGMDEPADSASARICMIMDISISEEYAKVKFMRLRTELERHGVRMNYYYNGAAGKARYALFGSSALLAAATEILNA